MNVVLENGRDIRHGILRLTHREVSLNPKSKQHFQVVEKRGEKKATGA